jgi:hypothetical protein
MGKHKLFTLEDMDEEYKKGQSSMATKIVELIKQRKWVWNEVRFGSIKHHNMFDSFVYELTAEVKRLKLKLEKEVKKK